MLPFDSYRSVRQVRGHRRAAGQALTPMPFHQHPSAMPMHPSMRNPVCVGTRGHFPSSRSPNIRSSVPSVITGYPNIASTWRRHPRLNHRTRRRHSNHNLLTERGESQNTCENNSDQSHSLASKIRFSFPANPETRSKLRNWAATLEIVRKARKLQCRRFLRIGAQLVQPPASWDSPTPPQTLATFRSATAFMQ